MALSKDKKGVRQLSKKGQVVEKPTDALKSHYVLKSDRNVVAGNTSGFMAQPEHTIVVTDATSVIMTGMNGIWN